MKIVGVVGSPRKKGNTEILMEEALAGARECGAETVLIPLADKDIKPCDGCRSCVKTGQCHIADDMQSIYPELLEAEGIIFGTPVYFFSVTGQAKVFLDRLYVLYRNCKLVNKVGGIIAVAGSLGHAEVWKLYSLFFSLTRMLPADMVQGFSASAKGSIRRDRHAMKAAWELGREMVLLAQQQFRFPEEYVVHIGKQVIDKYGIESAPVEESRWGRGQAPQDSPPEGQDVV